MTEAEFQRAVLAMCEELKEAPDGSRHWFEDGQHRSETFFDRNGRALRAALAAAKPN